MHGTAMVWLVLDPARDRRHRQLRDAAADRRARRRLPLAEHDQLLAGAALRRSRCSARSSSARPTRAGRSIRRSRCNKAPAARCGASRSSWSAVSSTLTGLNFIVTITKMRAPGMTWTRMPLFTWATFSTALINMIATVALSAALLALSSSTPSTCRSSTRPAAAAAVLYQHMFWFYSHPAVYIFILPAFGVISEVLPTFARKPIFGYKMIAFSSLAIAILGFRGLGAPHVPERPRAVAADPVHDPDLRRSASRPASRSSRGSATLWGGRIQFTTPMMYALAFLITFTFGGITGIFLACVPADLARARQLLRRRALPLRRGRRRGAGLPRRRRLLVPEGDRAHAEREAGQAELLAVLHRLQPARSCRCTGSASKACRAATPRTSTSPRRIPDAVFWNQFETISSFLMVAVGRALRVQHLCSLRNGAPAGNNPWGARTLEWMISSPPPYYNFKKIPMVLAGRTTSPTRCRISISTTTSIRIRRRPSGAAAAMPVPA